jgi:hypothetical protein
VREGGRNEEVKKREGNAKSKFGQVPLGKEAGVAIGRQGMESTSPLLSKEGMPLKEALKWQTRTGCKIFWQKLLIEWQ